MKLYQRLSRLVLARANCVTLNNKEWFEKHGELANQLVREHMPSGSGWDNGTVLDMNASNDDKLVFHGSYHHMDEYGHYDGWTDHTIMVQPSLNFGIKLQISGDDRNYIKNHIHEIFEVALTRTEVE